MFTADKVELRLSELTTIPLTVPQWETELLRATHGEDDVKVTGQEILEGEPPEPADEYARLQAKYKTVDDNDAQVPAIVGVYGKHGPGVASLASAIARATVTKKKAA